MDLHISHLTPDLCCAQQIDRFTNFMHTILTKVVPDNLKACPRFVDLQLMYEKWIPSIEILLLGTS